MGPADGDFELTLEELRLVARYVAECAEGILPVFEEVHPDDRRPRHAVEAAWKFINGAHRNNALRTCSSDAHRAARESANELARLAARAAGDAAAAAFLHPIAKGTQVGHILRAAACAARIAEIRADDPEAATVAIGQARRRANPELVEVLRRYPSPAASRNRVLQLMSELDAQLRRTA